MVDQRLWSSALAQVVYSGHLLATEPLGRTSLRHPAFSGLLLREAEPRARAPLAALAAFSQRMAAISTQLAKQGSALLKLQLKRGLPFPASQGSPKKNYSLLTVQEQLLVSFQCLDC